MNRLTKKLALIPALLLALAAQADVLQDIKPLQDRWAEANYSMSEEQKEILGEIGITSVQDIKNAVWKRLEKATPFDRHIFINLKNPKEESERVIFEINKDFF